MSRKKKSTASAKNCITYGNTDAQDSEYLLALMYIGAFTLGQITDHWWPRTAAGKKTVRANPGTMQFKPA